MISSVKENETALQERVNTTVREARLAAAAFTQYSQEQVDKIVKAMTLAAVDAVGTLAIAAHEETKMGVIEDKILKNSVASEFHYHQIKDKKTVGVIREFPQENIVEIAEPMGVILALSPVTNPTSTVIFKSIAAAKTRNTIIFSAHLMAADASNLTAKILYEAGLAAGAPKGFIRWVEKSPRLRRETELMMIHPEVDLIFATGGTNMVRVACTSGKPVLGVGSGNTPVYVHKSANVPAAAMDIIISKTFDNGTECPSEQTLVIDQEIADELLAEFKRLNCHICTPEEVDKVAQVALDPRTGGMNYKMVGQPANLIAEKAGIHVARDTKIILCPLVGDLRHHPLAVEKLMPVLGFVTSTSLQDGINRALDVNYAGGTGHTAGVFAEDDDAIEQYATAINAGRIVVNSPTSIGGLGGVYNNLNTTLSFGCGTGGGNITTDNVGIKNLLNYKRVPRRANFSMSFQTTKSIYINPGSLDHLKSLKTKTAFVVTSRSAGKRGHLSAVKERLPADCRVEVFSDISVEPDWETVQRAIAMMQQVQPDTIIALGGGSVLDAAKVMRIFYDHPETKIQEICGNFIDLRHRIADFATDPCTPLVAIPTTSGTGSEVTPFAVLMDRANHKKITLFDEALLPTVAILDANLTKGLPRDITIDTAFDALTHALEGLVSTLASDYTDGLVLESMRLIFEALPLAVENPSNTLWRHKLHNAACLAGMAIGNASVGVNHALAHALGAQFGISHGKANSVFLLTTIDFNSKIPKKFMCMPNYTRWVSDEKYARTAQLLGLDENDESPESKPRGKKLEQKDKERLILALKRAIYDLAKAVGQPTCISELGITPDQLQKAMPDLVKAAFSDLSARTNPSQPLINDFPVLFMQAFPAKPRP